MPPPWGRSRAITHFLGAWHDRPWEPLATLHAVFPALPAVWGLVGPEKAVFRAVEGSLRAMEGSLRAMEGSLRAMEGSLRAMEGSLRAMEGSLEAMEGSLGATEGSLEAMEGSLEATEGSLEATEGALEAMEGSLEATEGSLEATEGSLEAMEGSLEATEGSLRVTEGWAFSSVLSCVTLALATRRNWLKNFAAKLSGHAAEPGFVTDEVGVLVAEAPPDIHEPNAADRSHPPVSEQPSHGHIQPQAKG